MSPDLRNHVEHAKRLYDDHKSNCVHCSSNQSNKCGWFFNLLMSVKYFGRSAPNYLKGKIEHFYGRSKT